MLKRAFVAVTLTLATTSVTAPISGPADAAGTRESRIFYSACPGEVVEGACINSNGRRIPTELLSMRADGTGRDRVTRNRVHEQDPIWGPSGGRVVFEASDTLFNCNYDSYLATVPVWGSGAQQPVTRRGNYRCDEPADWSPDGNRLLFTRESTLCRDIWTVRRDGSGKEALTNNCDADPSSDEYASDPNWARDGERIVFSTGEAISIMTREGGNRHEIDLGGRKTGDLDVSPGGHHVAFVSIGPRGHSLFTSNLAGGDLERIVPPKDLSFRDIDWSPDGSRILFSGIKNNGGASLYVVGRHGRNFRKLASEELNALSDREYHGGYWSPNSKRIAFNAERYGIQTSSYAVAVMDADGSDVRLLTDYSERQFVWGWERVRTRP